MVGLRIRPARTRDHTTDTSIWERTAVRQRSSAPGQLPTMAGFRRLPPGSGGALTPPDPPQRPAAAGSSFASRLLETQALRWYNLSWKEGFVATIIAIANQKGGVGKTTTTINLGSYLAKSRQRVLVVDLDPQGNTTSGLGVDKQTLSQHLYHVMIDNLPVQHAIMTTPFHGMDVLPSSPDLAAAEIELVAAPLREHRLARSIRDLKYDYILVDCPPSLGLLTINGLVAAHSVLIPVQAEYYALEGLGQLIGTIQRVKKALNPQLELMGVLMTMHNGRTTLSTQVHDEVRRHFPDKVFDTIIPRNVRLAEAPSFGKPISHYDSWSKGAKGYKELAREVLTRAKQRT